MAEVTYPVLLDSTGQSMVAALNAIAGLTPSRGDVLAADFAQVEASSTSAHAYSVDDYLMLNDQLYKVTQPISIGDTITPGTNVTATAVTDELGSGGGATSLGGLSDVTLTTPSSGQFLKYDGVKWVNGSGGGGGASALDDLTDVDISTPSDGQSLIYDSDTQKWVNGSGGGGGASALNDLSDVTLTTPSAGQALVYDGSKWENDTLNIPSDLDDLSDVTISSPTSGQVLEYDGSKWANANLPSVPSDLDDLTDVTLTTPTSGQVLKYDGSKWVNGSGGGSIEGEGAGFHNSIYRGKSLGTSVSAAQFATIQSGEFEDMFIGDYWTIGNVVWRIAAFDYWLHCGDTECTTHHVVLVPDTNLYTAKMNDTNITTGGYTGSKMYTDNLASAKTTIDTAFGSAHILSHKELLVNAAASGSASGWAWLASTVELMSESMVYGHHACAANTSASGLGYETGIDKGQLPLFALEPSRICNRANWWLRDVVSSTSFALVAANGSAADTVASAPRGVRPVFAIC